MKNKIKWNNYIYSVRKGAVNKWGAYLRTAYPALKNRITVSLSCHSCVNIYIKYGSDEDLKHISDSKRRDKFFKTNVGENFCSLAEEILDKSKLDYEDYREIDDLTWYRGIYIKDTTTLIAYERFGVNKSDKIYCHLGLRFRSVPYIIDPELVKFAQQDLENRAFPLITKSKELRKQINEYEDEDGNVIERNPCEILEIRKTIKDINYKLSNKPPK